MMVRTRWKTGGEAQSGYSPKMLQTVGTDILTGYNQKAAMTPQPYVLICLNLILPVILYIYLTFLQKGMKI